MPRTDYQEISYKVGTSKRTFINNYLQVTPGHSDWLLDVLYELARRNKILEEELSRLKAQVIDD